MYGTGAVGSSWPPLVDTPTGWVGYRQLFQADSVRRVKLCTTLFCCAYYHTFIMESEVNVTHGGIERLKHLATVVQFVFVRHTKSYRLSMSPWIFPEAPFKSHTGQHCKVGSLSVVIIWTIADWSSVRWWLNSLWPSDAIWRHRSGSTLAQVMASALLPDGTKPLPEPLLTCHK